VKRLTAVLKALKAMQTILACAVLIAAFVLGDRLDLQEHIAAGLAQLKQAIRGKLRVQ
jgi:hypothetical protein